MSRVPPGHRVAPRPALGRARRRQIVGLAVAAAIGFPLVAVAAAGCSPAVPVATPEGATIAATASPARTTPTSATPTGATQSASLGQAFGGPALLLLAPGTEASSLSVVGRSGNATSLPLPVPSVAAVVRIAGGRLLAVLRDGRAFEAPPGAAGLAAIGGWQELALAGTGELPHGTGIWSATASPDGSLVAAIARPNDAESPSALVIDDPAFGRRQILPLADESEGIAPAWVDDSRVAILQRDRFDRPFIAIVAVATGRVTERLALRAQDIATSGDGRKVAVQADGRILVGLTASLLASGKLPATGPTLPPGDRVRGSLALDADGGTLAVAVEEGDAGPSRIAVYEHVGDSWQASYRIVPPVSASGGWLSWLP